MAREDLVGEVGQAVIRSELSSGWSALGDGGPVAELIRHAAEEVERLTGCAHPFPEPGDWDEYHLPHGYNRTRAVLLVRDPHWLHCYWEVGAAERDGIRARTGRELRELPNILRVHDRSASPATHFDLAIPAEARSWYLETGRPGHTFLVELGVDVPGEGFLVIARSNSVTTPIDRLSDQLDEEWMAIEEDFRRLYGMAVGLGPGHSSLALMESLAGRLAQRMGSGAVSSLGLGSGFRPPGPERRFWLVVGTELIVHGATQPDAAVTVDGLPVVLRPDGTFSARFALPDGDRSIAVTGVSRDGQDRATITPVVRKETH